jgi:hypothetical protein
MHTFRLNINDLERESLDKVGWYLFNPSKRLRTYSHAFTAEYKPDGIVPIINLAEKVIT